MSSNYKKAYQIMYNAKIDPSDMDNVLGEMSLQKSKSAIILHVPPTTPNLFQLKLLLSALPVCKSGL
jgi:hypothetical protein